MTPIRVAIHGFGRTGRQAFKAIWAQYRDRIEVAAIGLRNPSLAASAAHLLKYDSTYGRFAPAVGVSDGSLRVGDTVIPLVSAERLSGLPWAALGIDVVIESSGAYTTDRMAAGHLEAGAGKVILTDPSDDADFTLIYGVNEGGYDPARHHLLSAGSDTTNALAPMVQALRDRFEIKTALMTAVHASANMRIGQRVELIEISPVNMPPLSWAIDLAYSYAQVYTPWMGISSLALGGFLAWAWARKILPHLQSNCR